MDEDDIKSQQLSYMKMIENEEMRSSSSSCYYSDDEYQNEHISKPLTQSEKDMETLKGIIRRAIMFNQQTGKIQVKPAYSNGDTVNDCFCRLYMKLIRRPFDSEHVQMVEDATK